MLVTLRIKNFAIIEDQTINFVKGLNIISGETGSGKSLVLQALEILLGKKPKSEVLRVGAESWEIEGLFNLKNLDQNIFDSLPDLAQTKELVLYRSCAKSGKTKIYINGKTATLAMLTEIATKLINICGQGYYSKLFEPKFHIDLLDQYASNQQPIDQYNKAFNEYIDLKQELANLEQAELEREQKELQLEDLISELSAIHLYPGIRQEVETHLNLAQNSEKMLKIADEMSAILNATDGLYANFNNFYKLIKSYEKDLKVDVQRVLDADKIIQSVEKEINKNLSQIELDQSELEELRKNLSDLARLERKYRTDDQGLFKMFEQAKKDLEQIKAPDRIDRQQKLVQSAFSVCENLAGELSNRRKQAIRNLKIQIETELKELNMPDSKFDAICETSALSITGTDKIEFLISTNKGEPAKKLALVASGGELSRLMLVFKKALRDTSGVNVLIFDEIDTGISGAVARSLGEKLKAIAQDCQVICITHLAQVASLGDRHILIQKKATDRTYSIIKEIEGEEQLEEVARMIAGHKITAAAKETAKELLNWK